VKWYSTILNKVFKGIILFLLPVILLIFIVEKAIAIIQKMILPIKSVLPDQRILGIGLLTIISVALLVLICFLAGVLAERKRVKLFVNFIENNILTMIPGYSMMKSRVNEAIGSNDDEWKVVMMGADGEWKLGIAVEFHVNGYCTVFFPEPPDAKAGEMILVHGSKLEKLDIPVSRLITIIKTYGHGGAGLAGGLAGSE
jgi:uncharacterized membrane protein